jgi:hypothetical protein
MKVPGLIKALGSTLMDRFWFIMLYLLLSIAIAITGAIKNGWWAGFSAILVGALAFAAGSGLKAALCWSSEKKLPSLLIALVLMGAAYWLSKGFSAQIWGYSISGENWSLIGFVISFVFTTKEMATRDALTEPLTRDLEQAQTILAKYFKAFLDHKYPNLHENLSIVGLPASEILATLEIASQKMAYMALRLTFLKKYPNPTESETLKDLRAKAFGMIMAWTEIQLEAHNAEEGFTLVCVKAAHEQLEKCDSAVHQVIDNFLKEKSFPLDPVYVLVNQSIPLAKSGRMESDSQSIRETVYRETFKDMMELSSKIL